MTHWQGERFVHFFVQQVEEVAEGGELHDHAEVGPYRTRPEELCSGSSSSSSSRRRRRRRRRVVVRRSIGGEVVVDGEGRVAGVRGR